MNTVGEILKLRRKEKAMSLDYVCSELKISSDIIKKIESDKLFDKEYMVYYVGHLRAYSKLLNLDTCLLYTSPSPRDKTVSRMPSSA